MAGDSVNFSTRQRALSGDVNDLQSMATRQLADVLEHLAAEQVINDATPNAEQRTSAVIGGLTVVPAGADVLVAAGSLTQYSSGMLPVPGPYDSAQRIAIQRAAVAVTAPNPGSDTTYLLEAQMVDVVTLTQTRDIFDPGTQTFVPTSVPVRTERQIQYRFRAGTTTAAPAVDGQWVPIAIVFRPAGAPPTSAANIWDCRPLLAARESVHGAIVPVAEYGAPRILRRRLETVSTIAVGSAALRLDFEAVEPLAGERLFARHSGASVAISALPQSTLGAASLVYVYLYGGQGRPITNRVAGVMHRGLPVLSNVAPTKSGLNSGVITLVQPGGSTWGFDTCPAGTAVCVGAFVNNGGVAVPMTLGEDGAELYSGTALQPYFGAIGVGGATNFDVSGFVPADARFVDLRIDLTGAGAASADTILAIIDQATAPGGVAGGAGSNVYAMARKVDMSVNSTVFLRGIPVGIQTAFRLDTDYSATQPAGVAIAVTGWRY